MNANPRCLRWDADGKTHSASGLGSHIVEQATGQRVHVTGPFWWVDSEGNRLADVLEAYTGEPVYADPVIERDWSDLHDLLGKLSAGRWTSYGDLATAIGSSAMAVGQHVAVCNECPNVYRVLSSLKGRDRSRGDVGFFVGWEGATDRRRGQWWSARSRVSGEDVRHLDDVGRGRRDDS